jgi:DNA repair protein RadC
MEYPVFRIRDLAVEDRPREKCLRQGTSGLSNSELIAILIGTGTKKHSALDLARQVLQQAGNDLHHLGRFSLADLEKISGIGFQQ